MMKKARLLLIIFLAVLLLPAALFAQTRPRLAILPFTGSNTEDAETIAEFFSLDDLLLLRNSTAGPSVNLDSRVSGSQGGWE
jgi:hypothetical protein